MTAGTGWLPYGELLGSTGDTDTPFLFNGRDGVVTDANGLYYTTCGRGTIAPRYGGL